jgi:hypothetical protein
MALGQSLSYNFDMLDRSKTIRSIQFVEAISSSHGEFHVTSGIHDGLNLISAQMKELYEPVIRLIVSVIREIRQTKKDVRIDVRFRTFFTSL